MERREVFQEGFRALAKALPYALGAATGFGRLLNQNITRNEPAVCFPGKRTETPANQLPDTTDREE